MSKVTSPTGKKWSLWRHWKQASRAQQVKWIVAAITLILAAIGLWQVRENFRTEHRPRISAGSYTVFDGTSGQLGLVAGRPFGVDVVLRNVGKSTAFHVYIHRHVLFGKQTSLVKIEPPDINKVSQVLDPDAPPMTTSAVSVTDTYKAESISIDPNSLLPWDGTQPVIVFGRVTYEDNYGTIYCTPFGAQYLNTQVFVNLSYLGPQKISVDDLCPPGTIQ